MKKLLLIANIAIICAIILLLLAGKEQTTVAVSRRECPEQECDLLTNEGNVNLVIQRSAITGMLPLGVNNSMRIGKKENVTAEQDLFED